jgi:cyclopropane fatty-acyl-phospholipid synthase-like methyltransferase
MLNNHIAPKNVRHLYSITGVTPIAGICDYTDGIYNGNPALDHETAQKNQHNYLLDEIGAKAPGFRLLDVGCGLGTLLQTAKERGINGAGITISADQARQCKAQGLNVYLMNYRHIPEEWNGTFDGIIANGSLEHFCQPEDALAKKQDNIYKEMFAIFARLLDPASPFQFLATTAIHFRAKHVDPRKGLKHPLLQLFDAEGLHLSILHRGYGGYYPVSGQLEKCAKPYFRLIKEVDGTEDYRLTSEYWCRVYKKALCTNLQFLWAVLRHFVQRPAHTVWTVASYIGPEAWPWQFRGSVPPTRLYRQTWKTNSSYIG